MTRQALRLATIAALVTCATMVRLSAEEAPHATYANFAKHLVIVTGDPEFDGRQTPGDPLHWRPDIGRVRALGFTASTTLEEGLRDVAAWSSAELAK